MVTPLETGLLQHIGGGLFPFLLVLVLGYALLSKMVFKDKPGIAAIIALLLAMTTIASDIAVKTINTMAPWFVLFIIFGSFIMIAIMSFGIKEETIVEKLTGSEHGTAFTNWVLAIMLIIGLGSLFAVINAEKPIAGLQAGENVTAADQAEADGFFPTIFHPKVLGMVLILLVSYFTINHLSRKS